jgi:hypothetical protein
MIDNSVRYTIFVFKIIFWLTDFTLIDELQPTFVFVKAVNSGEIFQNQSNLVETFY